ncbi:peptidase domain-containing ABC transporter [Tenacibaculum caenipelagi]|uniref:ATP-binding cassette subfamily B protein n=1 Tax=Tenacibaculum caenipelagi TaxID=1325435 RepID=A0A4R6TEC4_9FLAO|nr:peptidase domain-containing ABC transporter [Tenacibaculum caenipelagi]TDQ25456.1 ATP-binding cassette subfamily B protein [Tenacibaculum caenipelagi]
MFVNKFPFFHQISSRDCGPTCLRIISKHYEKELSFNDLDKESLSYNGMSINVLSDLASKLNYKPLIIRTDFESIENKAPLPFVAHWNQNHYIVVYKITKKYVYVADPSFGKTKYTKTEFLRGWLSDKNVEDKKKGIALLLEPNEDFFKETKTKQVSEKRFNAFHFLKKYFLFYKYHVGQLLLGFFLGSLLQFAFPFITKSIIDFGIKNNNVSFLIFVLGFQILLFVLNVGIEFLRAHILIHVSSRINIFIISDFFVKIMKLPISFFTYKITGDLNQRIRDHERVERFISTSLLKSVFSFFSLAVFSAVLFVFSKIIFMIFLVGIIIELSWIFYFLKKVRILDQKSFSLNSEDQNKVFELITGIQDIKLNNIEDKKRWEWERIQLNRFDVSLKKLKLKQVQEGGQRFFSYLQIILVTFFSAYLTIKGELTLGSMMAILFIIGQMNAPISQLINFILQGQLAKLSIDRLIEIHEKEDEKQVFENTFERPGVQDIKIDKLKFSYSGRIKESVINNVSLVIPKEKITAIVGVSGSGKTTLLKLLLKFYDPTYGEIFVNNTNLGSINSSHWRNKCGAVLQDSFIFSDSIANNIALNEVNDQSIDHKKLIEACKIANIHDFIEQLPLKYGTKIGQYGIGLSQGQKQRLLIARAVYKNPDYLFFDEATNSLDAENEKVIINNLEKVYKGKTVVIVAHRLSTVKNADQIIVMNNGQISEVGTHEELVVNRERYYNLIKNQLELGV